MKRLLCILSLFLWYIVPGFGQGYVSIARTVAGDGETRNMSTKRVGNQTWIVGSTTSTTLPVTNSSVPAQAPFGDHFSHGGSSHWSLFLARVDDSANVTFCSYLAVPGLVYAPAQMFQIQLDVNGNTIAIYGLTVPGLLDTPYYSAKYVATDGSTGLALDGSATTPLLIVTDTMANIQYTSFTNGGSLHNHYQASSYKPVVDNGSVYVTGVIEASGYASLDPAHQFPSTDGSIVYSDNLYWGRDVYIRKYTNGVTDFARIIQSVLDTPSVETPWDMAVANGRMYLSLHTNGPNFPVTDGSVAAEPLNALDVYGNAEQILMAVDKTTGVTSFATHVGAVPSYGAGGSMKIDSTGVYLSGTFQSPLFPYTLGGPPNVSPDYYQVSDIFVNKYNASGVRQWSRILGSNSYDYLVGPSGSVLQDGNFYFAGLSQGADYPVVNGRPSAGGQDVVLTKLNTNGGIEYSGYFGGNGTDPATEAVKQGLALDVYNSEPYLYLGTSGGIPTTDGSATGRTVIAKFTSAGQLCMVSRFDGPYINDAYSYSVRGMKVVGDNIVILPGYFSQAIPVTDTPYYIANSNFSTWNAENLTQAGVMRYEFCPEMVPVISGDTLSPSSQQSCINGEVGTITGPEIYLPGDSLPAIYVTGSLSVQQDIRYRYQWQSATSAAGPWIDVPGQTTASYNPGPQSITTYFRRLTLGNPCCSNDTISISSVAAINLSANIAPVADAGGIKTTCAGSAIAIGGAPAASGGSAPYTYMWSLGADSIANPLVSPTVNSIYTLTVTDANGCQDIAQSIVNIYKADAGPDAFICTGGNIQIGTAPPAGLPGVSYSWGITSGTPGSLSCTTCARPVASPAVATTYVASMTITKSDNTTCTTTDTVVASPLPVLPANFAGDDQTLCSGSVVTLGTPETVIAIYPLAAVSQSSVDALETAATITSLSDADFTTGTITAIGTGEYVTIDLGTIQPVNQIQLAAKEPLYYEGSPSLQSSTDNITWTTVLPYLNYINTTNLTLFSFPATVQTRYLRVYNPYSDVVNISEFRARFGYNYSWTPGNNLAVNHSTASFHTSTGLPTPNPKTYTVTASAGSCTYNDDVQVTVVAASAGKDGCGPRILGVPDQTPGIVETYSWSAVSGTPNFTGPTNGPQVTVGATASGTTIYRVTVTYTAGGSTSACSDDVEVPADCGLPPADISFSGNGCAAGAGTTLTAEPPGNPGDFTYSWSPAAGLNSSSTRTVTLTDNVQRTYTAVMTSIIDTSYSVSDSIVANNAAFIPPAFTALDTIYACANAAVNVGSPAGNPNYTYQWLGAGLSATNVAYPLATSSSSAKYTVIISDAATGCTTRDSVYVVRSLKANAGPDIALCYDDVVTLGKPAVAGYLYSWDPAAATWTGGTDNTSAQPKPFVATTTAFVLTMTETATSCTSADTAIVTRGPAIPDFTLPALSYCPSGAALILGNSNGAASGTNLMPTGTGYSYLWNNPGLLNIQFLQNPSLHTPMPGTTKTFTVTVRNASGCQLTKTQTITPSLPSVNAGQDKIICSGSSTTIGHTGNTSAGGVTYSWSPVANLDDAASGHPVFTGTDTGTFTYTLTKTVAGCSTTDQVNIEVQQVLMDPVAPQTVCQGTVVTMGVLNANPLYNYIWTPATGLSNATIANPALTADSTRTYTLTATNGIGCSAAVTTVIGVYQVPAPVVTIPDITACLGAPNIMFNPSVTPAANYSYLWSPSTGLSSTIIANPAVNSGLTGVNTYVLKVTNDSTGCFNSDTVTATFTPCAIPSISISGTLYLDPNGMADGAINGTVTGIVQGTQMYVALVDTSNKVVASVPLSTDGTYLFSGIPGGVTYSLVLSGTPAIPGNAAPSPSLPSQQAMHTGEGLVPAGDGMPNGTIGSIATTNISITHADFGVGILPVATDDADSTDVDVPVTIAVQNNDICEGGSCTVAGLNNPPNGTISVNGDGTITYTPDPGYSGSDTFSYVLCNAIGCDTAQVVVLIHTNFPTPVDIISFEGKDRGGCSAELWWQTGVETGISGFEVETSRDGIRFTDSWHVAAKGSGGKYLSIYENAEDGVSFFRLKMLGNDGQLTYSKVLPLKISCAAAREIRVYPTVTAKAVTVSGIRKGESILIYDGAGRRLLQRRAMHPEEQIDMESFASGSYSVVVVTESDGEISFKVVRR